MWKVWRLKMQATKMEWEARTSTYQLNAKFQKQTKVSNWCFSKKNPRMMAGYGRPHTERKQSQMCFSKIFLSIRRARASTKALPGQVVHLSTQEIPRICVSDPSAIHDPPPFSVHGNNQNLHWFVRTDLWGGTKLDQGLIEISLELCWLGLDNFMGQASQTAWIDGLDNTYPMPWWTRNGRCVHSTLPRRIVTKKDWAHWCWTHWGWAAVAIHRITHRHWARVAMHHIVIITIWWDYPVLSRHINIKCVASSKRHASTLDAQMITIDHTTGNAGKCPKCLNQQWHAIAMDWYASVTIYKTLQNSGTQLQNHELGAVTPKLVWNGSVLGCSGQTWSTSVEQISSPWKHLFFIVLLCSYMFFIVLRISKKNRPKNNLKISKEFLVPHDPPIYPFAAKTRPLSTWS